MKRFALLLVIFLLAAACASKEVEEKSSAAYLSDGLELMEQKEYSDAATAFDQAFMTAKTPETAERAQFLMGNAFFAAEEYDEAISSYESYLDLYPKTKDAAQARFNLGISYYEKRNSIDRDQTNTVKALDIFLRLQKENPTLYKTAEIADKVKELREMLGEKEVYVAKFYFRIGQPEPGIGRYKSAVKDFADTTAFETAAYELTRYYIKTGNEEEARHYHDLLKQKRPESKLLKELAEFMKEHNVTLALNAN